MQRRRASCGPLLLLLLLLLILLLLLLLPLLLVLLPLLLVLLLRLLPLDCYWIIISIIGTIIIIRSHSGSNYRLG